MWYFPPGAQWVQPIGYLFICWGHPYEYCDSNLKWLIALCIMWLASSFSFFFFFFLKTNELVFTLLCCHWFRLFLGFGIVGQQIKKKKFLEYIVLQYLLKTKRIVSKRVKLSSTIQFDKHVDKGWQTWVISILLNQFVFPSNQWNICFSVRNKITWIQGTRSLITWMQENSLCQVQREWKTLNFKCLWKEESTQEGEGAWQNQEES